MDDETRQKYMLAGRIAAEVRDASMKIVKKGKAYTEIAEELESMIREKGGIPAFPVNISANEAAAHDTARPGDERRIGDDIVKIDVGVHIDGYIGDTAVTVCLDSRYMRMKQAAEKALAAAIELAKPGARIADISSVIEDTIKGEGYIPVANLTGHGLERYEQHSYPSIPNVKFKSDEKLKKGQAIAIEPFATNGEGLVKEGDNVIFGWEEPKSLRNIDARKIAEYAATIGTPFCERWIISNAEEIGCSSQLFRIRLALRELIQRGAIHEYPVLKDRGAVAQAEHTLIIEEEPIVTTKSAE